MAKRRVGLELFGAGLVALLCWRGLAEGSVDWREVTIEGFRAGVTPRQLEARFGAPCAIRDGVATWRSRDWRVLISYWQDRDGCHLLGNRILMDGREVARAASFLVSDLPYPSQASQIQALLGNPAEIQLQRSEPEYWMDSQEYESERIYRDSASDTRLKIRYGLAFRTSAPPVDSFQYIWKNPGAADPVIEGYSPGAPRYKDGAAYAVYPDQKADSFTCYNLKRNGQTIVSYGSRPEQVTAVLGKAVAETEAGSEWGYWGSSPGAGIIVRFEMEELGLDPSKRRVESIEVSRNRLTLANKLKQIDSERRKKSQLLLDPQALNRAQRNLKQPT